MNGLQDTCLGYVMNYATMGGEFLQIVHSLENHWLVIARIGMEIFVFDSLYDWIPSMVESQIACIVCTNESKLNVSIMDVQLQVMQC